MTERGKLTSGNVVLIAFLLCEAVLIAITIWELGRYYGIAGGAGPTNPGSIAEIETVRLGWWVLVLSAGQMLAGLLGIYLIARTLRANEGAVSVANDALSFQRKASVDESRSYVHASSATLERDAAGNARVQFAFKNTGQTPATYFEFAAEFMEVQRGTARQVPFPTLAAGAFKRWSPIGSGDEVTAAWQDSRFSERLRSYASRQQSVLLVLGAVRYRTIYAELYETQFAYFVAMVPPSGGAPVRMSRSTNPARAFHLLDINVPALRDSELPGVGQFIIPEEEELPPPRPTNQRAGPGT